LNAKIIYRQAVIHVGTNLVQHKSNSGDMHNAVANTLHCHRCYLLALSYTNTKFYCLVTNTSVWTTCPQLLQISA